MDPKQIYIHKQMYMLFYPWSSLTSLRRRSRQELLKASDRNTRYFKIEPLIGRERIQSEVYVVKMWFCAIPTRVLEEWPMPSTNPSSFLMGRPIWKIFFSWSTNLLHMKWTEPLRYQFQTRRLKNPFFQMGQTKAPGTDGLMASFYKRH
jgi:hypothetical protein